MAVSRRSVAERLRDRERCRVPSKRIVPDETGVRPRMARASVLLPLPDSPTMPTVSPGMTRQADAVDGVNRASPEQAARWRSAHAASRCRPPAPLRVPGASRPLPACPPPAARDGWRSATGVGVRRRGKQPALLAVLDHPACRITAMRSQVWATMPRSWVIRMIERPRRSRMSISSRRICAWIVTSSAVVGSSAIRIFGLQDSATRDHGALAHAAGELVRVAVVLPRRIGKADLARGSRPPRRARPRASEPLVEADALGDLVADPHHRVEMAGRVLEDHADLAAAHREHLGFRRGRQVAPVEQ